MKSVILLVDDEPNVIASLRRSLDEEPYEIFSASGGAEALAMMESTHFKVVVSDERMPGMDGAELLGIVRDRYPATVRIMLTGHASIDAAMRAVNSGEIYRFYTKPWDELQLKLAIRSAIEKHDLEEENRCLLRTVRRQSREIMALESAYPGISEIRRNDSGAFELPEISDGEIEAIISKYGKE